MLRSAAVLGGGTALAQAIGLALSPILTRVYSPSDFAELALFVSFVNVAVVGAALQYELSIPSTDDDRESAHLTVFCLIMAVASSLAGSLAMFWGIKHNLLGLGILPRYAALLVIPTLLFASAYTALRYWFIRRERFGWVSGAVVVQNVARHGSQTMFGVLGMGAPGLLTGEVLGRFSGTISLFRRAWPALRDQLRGATQAELATGLKRNYKYPLYSLPSSLVDTLGSNLTVPLVIYYYGAHSGGEFALLQKVLGAPMVLVAASMADAFHSRISLCLRENPAGIPSVFRQTTATLLLLSIIPGGVLWFFGDRLFALLFGAKWAMAGTLAALVVPWFVAQFVVSPLSRVVFVLRGQEWKLIYDAFSLGTLLATFAVAKMRGWSLIEALRLLVALKTFSYFVYYLVLRRILNRTALPSGGAERCA